MEQPQDSDDTLVDQPPLSPSPSPSPSPLSDQSDDDGGDYGDIWKPEWKQTSALLNSIPDSNHVPIGLVYLAASQNFGDPLHVGELSMGIIIKEEYRGKGYGREVVQRVARIAFDEAKCHRLQAILLGRVALDRALSLFTKMLIIFPFLPLPFLVYRFLLTFYYIGTFLMKALADARSLALCSTSGRMRLIWRFLTQTG
jgi:GNAT superfamily N-acetyltransferase